MIVVKVNDSCEWINLRDQVFLGNTNLTKLHNLFEILLLTNKAIAKSYQKTLMVLPM